MRRKASPMLCTVLENIWLNFIAQLYRKRPQEILECYQWKRNSIANISQWKHRDKSVRHCPDIIEICSVFTTSKFHYVTRKHYCAETHFISYPGVVYMLVNLKTKASCGHDNIPNVFPTTISFTYCKIFCSYFSLFFVNLTTAWWLEDSHRAVL